MNIKPPPKGTVFDAELWQLHYDQMQEPLIIAISNLGRTYKQLKTEHDKAPAHLKSSLYARLKQLETTIETMEESLRLCREFVGSIVISLYLECERVTQLQAIDIGLMQQTLETVSSVALTLCEQRITKLEKQP